MTELLSKQHFNIRFVIDYKNEKFHVRPLVWLKDALGRKDAANSENVNRAPQIAHAIRSQGSKSRAESRLARV